MEQAEETAPDSALEVPWKAAAIVILPGLVLLIASVVLMKYGAPLGEPSAPHLAAGQAEAAGRISVLGTAILAAAVAVLALGQFARDLFLLTRESRTLLLATALGCALIGSLFVLNGFPEDADRYLGRDFACRSFALVDSPEAPDAPRAESAKPCGPALYDRMKHLNHGFKYLLAFVSPALIFGTISCLGRRPGSTPADRKRALARLKTYLYLSAAQLVSGLAFLGALLRWPGFSVGDDSGFAAGVSAIILYWGIVYSIFIASYYIPVVLFGAKRWGPAGKEGPPLTPIGLVQSGAAIFAPAIAGLLGGLVHL